MLWGRIKGHDRTLDQLERIISLGRPAHAYLFSGPRGVGKAETAKVFAAALNCERACGTCASCRAVLNHTHSDFHYVAPEGTRTIMIDQIRDLLHVLNLTQQAGRFKTAVIDDAQFLGQEAANALLKTLEEPPGDVVFILVADDAGQVPPTVASRCQRVRFGALGADVVQDILAAHGVDQETARLAARLARGQVGEALEMSRNGLLEFRPELVDVLTASGPSVTSRVRLCVAVTASVKTHADRTKKAHARELAQLEELAGGPGKMGAGVKKKIEARQKRELARAERALYRHLLVLIASVFRDMLLIYENADTKFITNGDLMIGRQPAGDGTRARVSSALARIEETGRKIEQNVSPIMALENLFFLI